MNVAFWCNGKKGFCDDKTKCGKCKHYDETGGEEREKPKLRIIKGLRIVKRQKEE